MKRRKLVPRFRIRYFRDDEVPTLWKWESGKMTRNNGGGQSDWLHSVRFPHHNYGANFREIREVAARRFCPQAFMSENELNSYKIQNAPELNLIKMKSGGMKFKGNYVSDIPVVKLDEFDSEVFPLDKKEKRKAFLEKEGGFLVNIE